MSRPATVPAGTALTKVPAAGSESRTITLAAAFGPAFVTVTV